MRQSDPLSFKTKKKEKSGNQTLFTEGSGTLCSEGTSAHISAFQNAGT